MRPELNSLDARQIAILAVTSFILGILTPWIFPPARATPPDATTSSRVSTSGVGAEPAQASEQSSRPPVRTPRGVIALGDHALHAVGACLEARGIDVYPRVIGTHDDLLAALQRLGNRHAAFVIHLGERQGLVDGQVRQILELVGVDRRVVWVTMRASGAGWGSFSFEDRTNASIRNVISRSEQGRVMDWRAITARHPELVIDSARTTTAGCEEYARRVAKLSGAGQGR